MFFRLLTCYVKVTIRKVDGAHEFFGAGELNVTKGSGALCAIKRGTDYSINGRF